MTFSIDVIINNIIKEDLDYEKLSHLVNIPAVYAENLMYNQKSIET